MIDAALISDVTNWLDSNVLVSTSLAIVGAATVFAMAVLVLVHGVRFVTRLVGASSSVSNRKVRRAGMEPGHRVIIGPFVGPRGSQAREAIEQSIDAHMSDFSFGAQFRRFRVNTVTGRPEGDVLSAARKKLHDTGADMLIWGARFSDDPDGMMVFGVSRGGALTAEQATPFVLHLPGKLRRFEGEVGRMTAYFLAKRLQPALARPEAFRVEKIAELGSALDGLIDIFEANHTPLPASASHELETDFAAITLHLSETAPQKEWIDKLIERRRATLESLKAMPDAEAQIDARLDLGRALIKRAEMTFDPVAVREATVHLNAAIESLRGHDVIRKAQGASDALQRAQSLVETRRRFAVNFSG